jgi:hypothetical protein
VRLGTPERAAANLSLFVRHFLLSFYVSSCYNPIEIQFKLPRRFLPEKHEMRGVSTS